jgi:chorismate dehydratase
MLKIGALSFINALPFFCPFIDKRIQFNGQFTFGSPTQINRLLEQEIVDIGLISSASFIANRDQYILLTNLGIGATKLVKSVCLYTKKDIRKLDGKTIAIPDVSATSVMLLKVLCEHYWQVKPNFVEYNSGVPLSTLLQEADGALIIGDVCLMTNAPGDVQVIDMCEAWYNFTKKPFVFAVFATRLDSWMRLPDEVRDFHQKLFAAYDYSNLHFDEILAHAHSRTGLSIEALKDYYNVLDYYLDSAHFQGLEQFAKLKVAEHVKV